MSRQSPVPKIGKPIFSSQLSYWYVHNSEGLPSKVGRAGNSTSVLPMAEVDRTYLCSLAGLEWRFLTSGLGFFLCAPHGDLDSSIAQWEVMAQMMAEVPSSPLIQ